MNLQFIVVAFDYTKGGFWGRGETIGIATERMRKSGCPAKLAKQKKVVRFTSELPFVKDEREALAPEGKANCWVDGDGGLNWIRCEREVLENWVITVANGTGQGLTQTKHDFIGTREEAEAMMRNFHETTGRRAAVATDLGLTEWTAIDASGQEWVRGNGGLVKKEAE